MKIYIDNQQINLKNLHITKYENKFNEYFERIRNTEIDFSSLSKLKGNKDLLNKAFIAELKEQLI